MAEKIVETQEKQTITLEELAVSNSMEIAAMFNILQKKGLISWDEVQEELKKMQTQH